MSRFRSSYAREISDAPRTFEYQRPNTAYEWRRHRGIELDASSALTPRTHGAALTGIEASAHEMSQRRYPKRLASIYAKDFEGALSQTRDAPEVPAAESARLARATKYDQTRPPREHDVLCPAPLLSTCHRELGEFGYRPADAHARHVKALALEAGNADLSAGSNKLTNHPPGYTGFVPADPQNIRARRQATGNFARPIRTSAVLNCSREMVPHYAGYRPSEPSFNENRKFVKHCETEYSDAYFASAVDDSVVARQEAQRVLFTRMLNPWNAASFTVS